MLCYGSSLRHIGCRQNCLSTILVYYHGCTRVDIGPIKDSLTKLFHVPRSDRLRIGQLCGKNLGRERYYHQSKLPVNYFCIPNFFGSSIREPKRQSTVIKRRLQHNSRFAVYIYNQVIGHFFNNKLASESFLAFLLFFT